MIRQIKKEEIYNCVEVICKSFMTVANEFGFTEENAPGFTAFATTEERLLEHAFAETGKMGCSQVNIGIVEENLKLRKWYEAHGAEHIGTENMISFRLLAAT